MKESLQNSVEKLEDVVEKRKNVEAKNLRRTDHYVYNNCLTSLKKFFAKYPNN